jgi:ESF2/ABP1 family protein
MSSKKRNEWLEADLEDDEISQDTDRQEEGRGHAFASRSTKRRKLDSDIISASEASDDENDDLNGDSSKLIAEGSPATVYKADAAGLLSDEKISETPKDSKIDRKLAKTRDASSRSGVIYISHIPPFMKPHTLKNLLSPFAPSGLGRIYLTPEDQDRRQARVRAGGNKKRSFVDGWVEVTSKKEAKMVVETLNTRSIGGKKGGYYFDDVWNLKYLKGFKWRHLTEQIMNENEERAARMRAEASSSKREMREFLRNVERAKIEETRQKKRDKKAEKLGLDQNSTGHVSSNTRMGFNQSVPIEARKKPAREADDEIKEQVLSQIF